MERTFDVVVIGGGIAGVSAALAVVARGARVAVVRATPGATGLASGAWSGPLPEPVARALSGAGLAHEPCAHALPHPSGEFRTCTHAPASHAFAQIDARTVVCGIAGLAGFHAQALARLWAAGPDSEPMSVMLRIDGTPQAGWSPVALAAALERDPSALARSLAEAVRDLDAERAVLPAVLGLETSAPVIAALRAQAGVEVAEALGVPPSVPGWRLGRALDRALQQSGIEVIAGHAQGRGNGSRNLRRLTVTPSRVRVDERAANAPTRTGGPLDVGAAVFVLATGKFAGGGITGEALFRETALDCPVWVEHLGQRFDAPHPLSLTNAERTAPQPILMAGVRTDASARPVDPNGDVVYENVIVAGSVRSGVATVQLGLGAAAEDGLRAGELAAEVVP